MKRLLEQIQASRLTDAACLRHAIVITTKPHFVVKRTCNTKVRLGGDNNGVTYTRISPIALL